MKASANRTQDNESRAVANNVSCQREEREAVRFVDNSSHTKSIAQLQAIADRSVNPHDVQMRKLFAIINNSPQRKTPVLPGVTQKKGPLDEEELQFKSKEAVQKKGPLDEEELQFKKDEAVQCKGPLDEEELQFKSKEAVQKKGPLDEEELQFKKDETVQCKGPLDEEELQFKAEEPVQQQENKTGLPDDLKAGVENLSGMAMDDVRVHYNSGKPAQLNAYAYTQGTEIHVAPGQEKHLPHEAWHVVQQKQGRVQPTMQMKGGVAVNDDKGLETEADGMGEKALQFEDNRPEAVAQRKLQEMVDVSSQKMQPQVFQVMAANVTPVVSFSRKQAEPLQRMRDKNSISDEEINATAPAEERNSGRDRDTMENDYQESLKSGVKLRAAGLEWYNGTTKSDDVNNPYNDFSSLGYKHDWVIEKDNEVTIGTGRGNKKPKGEQCKHIDDDGPYYYINKVNIETGAITADNNWRELDNKKNEVNLGTAPQNSEMLWFHYNFAWDKVKATAPDGGPKSIKRSSISNQRTVDTVLMCTHGAQVSLGGSCDFKNPFDNDTWAVLGTPNANSAVWMLIQHGKGAGMADIEKITASKDSEDSPMDMEINYIAARK